MKGTKIDLPGVLLRTFGWISLKKGRPSYYILVHAVIAFSSVLVPFHRILLTIYKMVL